MSDFWVVWPLRKSLPFGAWGWGVQGALRALRRATGKWFGALGLAFCGAGGGAVLTFLPDIGSAPSDRSKTSVETSVCNGILQ